MSETVSVEQRLSALEGEVAELKRQLDQLQGPNNWLQRVSGSFQGGPEYEEMFRMSLKIREENRQRAAQ